MKRIYAAPRPHQQSWRCIHYKEGGFQNAYHIFKIMRTPLYFGQIRKYASPSRRRRRVTPKSVRVLFIKIIKGSSSKRDRSCRWISDAVYSVSAKVDGRPATSPRCGDAAFMPGYHRTRRQRRQRRLSRQSIDLGRGGVQRGSAWPNRLRTARGVAVWSQVESEGQAGRGGAGPGAGRSRLPRLPRPSQVSARRPLYIADRAGALALAASPPSRETFHRGQREIMRNSS